MATELDPEWYRAWHTWALANFEVITQLEVSQYGLSSAHFTTYIIPAVEGRSTYFTKADSVQASCGPLRFHLEILCKIHFGYLPSGSPTGTSMESVQQYRKESLPSMSMYGWRSFRRQAIV